MNVSWLMAVGCWLIALAVPRATSHERRATSQRTTWDSVYTVAQAARGETLYVKSCARCHRESLSGADESPPLAGASFLANWNGLPLSNLEERIRTTMPTDSVGIYDRRVVTDVITYLLKANGFPAGGTELSSDSLKTVVLRAEKR